MRYFLIKTFWFFANPIKKVYFFIFRPNTRGVKCIIENNGKLLMVKLNYAHHKWTFPGGKVEKNESFLDAAIREAKEETGIDAINVKYAGSYESTREYKRDRVEIYVASTEKPDARVIEPTEIEKVEWFDRLNMPQEVSPAVAQILKIYDEYKNGVTR